MVNTFGNTFNPNELILPTASVVIAEQTTMSGAIFISGNRVYVRTANYLLALSGSNILT